MRAPIACYYRSLAGDPPLLSGQNQRPPLNRVAVGQSRMGWAAVKSASGRVGSESTDFVTAKISTESTGTLA
ncbi:MAG: hypothetical protein ACK5TK_06155, partial [Betaproteobacteria bacterium]